GVDDEAEADAGDRDRHTGERRADHPRGVEEAGVERDRVRQPARPDHLEGQRLTTGRVARPVSVTTASTTETSIAAACVVISRRLVSMRSTKTPATRLSRKKGRKRQNARAPIASGELESWITSHASPMFCIQVPATEISWPVKNSR